MTMRHKHQHQPEVLGFLQDKFSRRTWAFTFPQGSGHETYLASTEECKYFVKLGAHVEKYQVMASMGLSSPVLASGRLVDGTSIMVQSFIAGRIPSRRDYRKHLRQFAMAIHTMHHSSELRRVLPSASSECYSVIGLQALASICRRWELYKRLVPEVAHFVDVSLESLRRQVSEFRGIGLVASHNDICNANWLITPDEKLFLIDLESMSLEDPALDIGATLWWYYPLAMRAQFLSITASIDDIEFKKRMQVRMAMHCLHILIPRENSYDAFIPAAFTESLTDFRAILAGENNPQGYED